MLEITKNYVIDENPEFEKIEKIVENYGLAKLMRETDDDERLSKEAALKYYNFIKDNPVDN